MTIATAALLALTALVQFVAAAAARTRPFALVLFAASGGLLALSAATGAIHLALSGGLLACLAPLAWTRGQDSFHLHHHVFRLVVVGAVVGWFAWAHS